MGILKWQISLTAAHIISTSTWPGEHHTNPLIAKPLQDLWVLNEFKLAGLRQPQVRETDGGTTHTGLQGIILCVLVDGNISWKFQDDTMTGTLSKRCDGQTDGKMCFLELLGRS